MAAEVSFCSSWLELQLILIAIFSFCRDVIFVEDVRSVPIGRAMREPSADSTRTGTRVVSSA